MQPSDIAIGMRVKYTGLTTNRLRGRTGVVIGRTSLGGAQVIFDGAQSYEGVCLENIEAERELTPEEIWNSKKWEALI